MKVLLNVLFVCCLFLTAFQVYGKMAWVEQENHLFNKQESAIYFQYAGIVLEPFYPIFISSEKPLEPQLKNEFKHYISEPSQVSQFIVSSQDLDEMIVELNKDLQGFKNTPYSRDQKRVVIGVMLNGHLIRWTLSHEATIPFLSMVQKKSVNKYDGLYKSILYFEYRLGASLTNDEKKLIGH